MCLIITDFGQLLVAVLDDRRTFIRADRGDGFYHIRDLIGIFHHDLIGLVASEIVKFSEHLIRSMQKQRRLVIRIFKSPAGHDDTPVDLVLRIQKMYIAGSHHRLVELFPQLHDTAVHILDIFYRMDTPDPLGCNHEFIVPRGLDFQIVIKVHNPCNGDFALFIQQGPVQFPGFAGTAQKQPVSVFHNQALGDPGMAVAVIGQVGFRYQPV